MRSADCIDGRNGRWRVEQEAAIAARPKRFDLCSDECVGRALRGIGMRARKPDGMTQRMRGRIEAAGGIDHDGIERLQLTDGYARAIEECEIGVWHLCAARCLRVQLSRRRSLGLRLRMRGDAVQRKRCRRRERNHASVRERTNESARLHHRSVHSRLIALHYPVERRSRFEYRLNPHWHTIFSSVYYFFTDRL